MAVPKKYRASDIDRHPQARRNVPRAMRSVVTTETTTAVRHDGESPSRPTYPRTLSPPIPVSIHTAHTTT